jgi:hypothetical protein
MATGESTNPGPGAPEPPDVEELTDDDTGRWQITTDSGSTYLLDLDQRLVTRTPAPTLVGHQPGHDNYYLVTHLEGDHEPQPLYQLVRCTVGEGMYLLRNQGPAWVTVCGTTPVCEIRPLLPTDSTSEADDG